LAQIGFQSRAPLGGITREWTTATLLRAEYGHRTVLVEIDAFDSVMLGIPPSSCAPIYGVQFGVLRNSSTRRSSTLRGAKIAMETHFRLGSAGYVRPPDPLALVVTAPDLAAQSACCPRREAFGAESCQG
jgi:hypothetical protein